MTNSRHVTGPQWRGHVGECRGGQDPAPDGRGPQPKVLSQVRVDTIGMLRCSQTWGQAPGSAQRFIIELLSGVVNSGQYKTKYRYNQIHWRINSNWHFRYSTPLHDSVCCGRQEVVRLLLEAGAPVDALDYKEATPLRLAIRWYLELGTQDESRAML